MHLPVNWRRVEHAIQVESNEITQQSKQEKVQTLLQGHSAQNTGECTGEEGPARNKKRNELSPRDAVRALEVVSCSFVVCFWVSPSSLRTRTCPTTALFPPSSPREEGDEGAGTHQAYIDRTPHIDLLEGSKGTLIAPRRGRKKKSTTHTKTHTTPGFFLSRLFVFSFVATRSEVEHASGYPEQEVKRRKKKDLKK